MTTPSSAAIDRGGMRASDGDRQLVHELLQTAYVDGRLTKDELEERIEQVFAAKTFNDLAPLTADLLATPVAVQYTTPAARASSPLVETPTSDNEQINVVLGEVKRTNSWRLHPRTEVNVFLGEVVLDLREAVLESSTPHITVNGCLGELRVLVPEGMKVTNKLHPMLAEVKVKGLRDHDATAELTIAGTMFLFEVAVVGPDKLSRKDRKLGQ